MNDLVPESFPPDPTLVVELAKVFFLSNLLLSEPDINLVYSESWTYLVAEGMRICFNDALKCMSDCLSSESGTSPPILFLLAFYCSSKAIALFIMIILKYKKTKLILLKLNFK